MVFKNRWLEKEIGVKSYDVAGRIIGNKVLWNNCLKIGDQEIKGELSIKFSGTLSEDGQTFMGTGSCEYKSKSKSLSGSVTIAAALAQTDDYQ